MSFDFQSRIFCIREGILDIAKPLTSQDEQLVGLSRASLDNTQEGSRIFICGESSSAFDVAWHLERNEPLEPWDSVLAVSQSSGRGQLRRHWHSPAGNIYAVLKLPCGIQGDIASLVVGFLVVKSLRQSLEYGSGSDLDSRIKLKWPNDVLLDNFKVGGILLEEKNTKIMAGIGLNLVSAPGCESLREEFACPASCLLDLLKENFINCNISALSGWVRLVSLMRFWYETKVLLTADANLPQLIESELAWNGKMVKICDHHDMPDKGMAFGQLLGLGSNGELRLAFGGREKLVTSGSVYLV